MKNEEKLPMFLNLPSRQGLDPVSAKLHFRIFELKSDGIKQEWYRAAGEAAADDSDRRIVDETVEAILQKSFEPA